MRPVDRGPIPQKNGHDIVYTCYQEARGDLIARMGELCSYCEMHLDAGLAVEHVQPKSLQSDKEYQWGNFLLACTNCNSTKKDKDINDQNLNDYLWPDKDNTFLAFEYTEGGEVRVNPNLPDDIRLKAEKLIHLVGLDKGPNDINTSKSDRRWENRYDIWGKATKVKQVLLETQDKEAVRKTIEIMAESYFSIWMTVFADDPDMCRRFINKFRGTAKDCFDSNRKPQNRQGGQI